MSSDFVAIEIEGREWKVCLDFNAMCLFEQARSKTIGSVFQAFKDAGNDLSGLSALDLRCLVWCVLRRHQKEITVERVGELLHQGTFTDLFEKIQDAMQEFMPKDAGEIEDPRESPNLNSLTG